ncbi:hypothetical protein [Acrocarpospora sp. B8E8]|uniref:hypothetical protein n=1 Tax=Acrocarpospora sp. B8E8 TaxID=3153572 RepID=UPI00325F2A65
MDDREKLRLRLTRDVMGLLRHRDFREKMPALSPDGEVAVMVAFRDDTMEFVMGQVARLGDASHVVVPPSDLSEWPARMTLLRVHVGAPV